MFPVGVDVGVRRVTLACARAIDNREFGWTDELDLGKPGNQRHVELSGLASFVWHSIAEHGLPHHDVLIVIEKTFVSNGPRQNRNTTIGLTQVGSAVMTAAVWGDCEIVVPSSWKLSLIGVGDASKDHIREWLANQHPDLHAVAQSSQDRIDAMCMSLYGRNLVAGRILAVQESPARKTAQA